MIAMAFAATAVAACLYLFRAGGVNGDADAIETVPVRLAPFQYTVTEKGEVESSNSVEVRCEVKSRNSAGTTG